jgi:thioredoxin reductase (NADPH)
LGRLRVLVAEDRALGDIVLRAFLIRRSLLIEAGAGLRILGSRYSEDTRRLREFAARNRLPYRWIDLESDAEAEGLLRELSVPMEDTPVVIWLGKHVLRNPSNAELARVIGLPMPGSGSEETVWDLAVVGGGPAGLGAAVHGASEGLSTIVLECVATGGQANTSSRIENFLGFPLGVSGSELAERARIQAENFGAHFAVPAEVTALDRGNGCYALSLADGTTVRARAVVIATGSRYRRPAIPGLAELEASSVYYAATTAEARMFLQVPVVVVGGGNSAGQAALYLSGTASHVWLLVRGDDLDASMSRYLVDRIRRNAKITVLAGTEVRELVGKEELEALVVEDRATRARQTLAVRAIFAFIGGEPHTNWLKGKLDLDDHDFIRTSRLLETSLPGVFAAGDVRSGSTKRVASAVGEGAMAIRLVHNYLIETVGR